MPVSNVSISWVTGSAPLDIPICGFSGSEGPCSPKGNRLFWCFGFFSHILLYLGDGFLSAKVATPAVIITMALLAILVRWSRTASVRDEDRAAEYKNFEPVILSGYLKPSPFAVKICPLQQFEVWLSEPALFRRCYLPKILFRRDTNWMIPINDIAISEIRAKGSLGTWNNQLVWMNTTGVTDRLDPIALDKFVTPMIRLSVGYKTLVRFPSDFQVFWLSLQHANINKFLGVSFGDKEVLIVTDFVKRGSLKHLLQSESLDADFKVALIMDVTQVRPQFLQSAATNKIYYLRNSGIILLTFRIRSSWMFTAERLSCWRSLHVETLTIRFPRIEKLHPKIRCTPREQRMDCTGISKRHDLSQIEIRWYVWLCCNFHNFVDWKYSENSTWEQNPFRTAHNWF